MPEADSRLPCHPASAEPFVLCTSPPLSAAKPPSSSSPQASSPIPPCPVLVTTVPPPGPGLSFPPPQVTPGESSGCSGFTYQIKPRSQGRSSEFASPLPHPLHTSTRCPACLSLSHKPPFPPSLAALSPRGQRAHTLSSATWRVRRCLLRPGWGPWAFVPGSPVLGCSAAG